jgi:hypothetical protein
MWEGQRKERKDFEMSSDLRIFHQYLPQVISGTRLDLGIDRAVVVAQTLYPRIRDAAGCNPSWPEAPRHLQAAPGTVPPLPARSLLVHLTSSSLYLILT